MRRKDREITEFEEIIDVMERCGVCRLALHDEEYPYIVPLNFGMQVEEGQIVLYFHGAEEGKRRVLGKCTYGIWNEEAYQLYMDVSTLSMLLTTLEENSLRAARIAKALQQFTLIADFEQPREGRIASYKEAREALRPVMEAKNGSTAPVFYAVGNAHLDLAWLWPMAETYRKTERTFAAQLRLIEEYPEYKFIQSQPASYEMCKKYYPELFARIKEAIKGGQWIADGAMWVEADCNLTSGESLTRQILIGSKFIKDEFGKDVEFLWLPDVFGYSWALPQILKLCNIRTFMTTKISWNQFNTIPDDLFFWRGIDGSEILTYFVDTPEEDQDINSRYSTYNGRMTPHSVLGSVRKFKNKELSKDTLISYGYGDGGGGVTRDMLEMQRAMDIIPGLPM